MGVGDRPAPPCGRWGRLSCARCPGWSGPVTPAPGPAAALSDVLRGTAMRLRGVVGVLPRPVRASWASRTALSPPDAGRGSWPRRGLAV